MFPLGFVKRRRPDFPNHTAANRVDPKCGVIAISKTSNGPRRPFGLTFALVAVIGAAAFAGLWYVVPGPQDSKPPIRSSGTAAIGGPFTLTDQTGRTVTDKTYAGKFELVYFGYTYCPDACPTDLQVMTTALNMLGDSAKQVQPIFITIDPERDTAAVMADYVSHFHPSFIGLTGTPEQTAAAAEAYRVYYKKAPSAVDGGAYLMDHSSYTYLMGPDGGFLENFAPGTDPEDMALRIREIMGGVPA